MTRIEIEGVQPDADRLWTTAQSPGHFTAMQVRGGGTRGLDLHLRRLEDANRELFGAALDAERVRVLARHALRDTEDASVRVYVFGTDDGPATMVTVRPPEEIATPQRLRCVRYQRPDAHIKRVTTDQGHYRNLVQREGFDDALLTADDGTISETTMTNVGFFDAVGVVWPDAPMLRGITMQLLDMALLSRAVPVRRGRVRSPDVSTFEGAFLTNARGIAAVSRIDEADFPQATERLGALLDVYASVSWDAI